MNFRKARHKRSSSHPPPRPTHQEHHGERDAGGGRRLHASLAHSKPATCPQASRPPPAAALGSPRQVPPRPTLDSTPRAFALARELARQRAALKAAPPTEYTPLHVPPTPVTAQPGRRLSLTPHRGRDARHALVHRRVSSEVFVAQQNQQPPDARRALATRTHAATMRRRCIRYLELCLRRLDACAPAEAVHNTRSIPEQCNQHTDRPEHHEEHHEHVSAQRAGYEPSKIPSNANGADLSTPSLEHEHVSEATLLPTLQETLHAMQSTGLKMGHSLADGLKETQTRGARNAAIPHPAAIAVSASTLVDTQNAVQDTRAASTAVSASAAVDTQNAVEETHAVAKAVSASSTTVGIQNAVTRTLPERPGVALELGHCVPSASAGIQKPSVVHSDAVLAPPHPLAAAASAGAVYDQPTAHRALENHPPEDAKCARPPMNHEAALKLVAKLRAQLKRANVEEIEWDFLAEGAYEEAMREQERCNQWLEQHHAAVKSGVHLTPESRKACFEHERMRDMWQCRAEMTPRYAEQLQAHVLEWRRAHAAELEGAAAHVRECIAQQRRLAVSSQAASIPSPQVTAGAWSRRFSGEGTYSPLLFWKKWSHSKTKNVRS